MPAAPMGIPGCPEFAFSTPSAESILIVFTHKLSSFVIIFSKSSFLLSPDVQFLISSTGPRVLSASEGISCPIHCIYEHYLATFC
jgi:hypothetical protein